MEPAFKISVVFQMVRASVRIVLSVNDGYWDGTSRRVTAKDETKVFGKKDDE